MARKFTTTESGATIWGYRGVNVQKLSVCCLDCISEQNITGYESPKMRYPVCCCIEIASSAYSLIQVILADRMKQGEECVQVAGSRN